MENAAINNRLKTAASNLLKVSDVIDYSVDAIELVCTATGSKEIVVDTYGSPISIRTPSGMFKNKAVFNAAAGDRVYIYPDSNNWEDLKAFVLKYTQKGEWRIDFEREQQRLRCCEEIFLKFVFVQNANFNRFSNFLQLKKLWLQTDIAHSDWQGNISSVSQVDTNLSLYGCWNLTGDVTCLNTNLNELNIQSNVVCSDSSFFTQLQNMTYRISLHISRANVIHLRDFANIERIELNANVSGDLSDLSLAVQNKRLPTIYNAPNVTGNLNLFAGISGNKSLIFHNCPLITGDFSILNKITSIVSVSFTNIHQYTTAPNSSGFASLSVAWANSITPTQEADLARLIADKRLYVEQHNQTGGAMWLVGNNVAITDTQALADIDFLRNKGWVVNHN